MYTTETSSVAEDVSQKNNRQLEQVVVVMRHGERRDGAVDAPAEADPPLTQDGLAQIVKTARKLQAILGVRRTRRMVLVISPFLRTLQTAQELQRCGVGDKSRRIIDNTICEVYGPMRIKCTSEPLFPDVVMKSASGKLPQWGESIEMASQRYVENFHRLCYMHPNRDLLLVTHGDAISAIMTSIYPRNTVYETEYLSFIAFRRFPEYECNSGSCGSELYQMFESNGVQWLVEGPESSSTEAYTFETDNVPDNSMCATEDFPKYSCLIGDGYRAADTNNSNTVMIGNLSASSKPHERNDIDESVGITTILLRFLLVVSQLLAIPFWCNKGNALIYVIVVGVVEMILLALRYYSLHSQRFPMSLTTAECIYNLTTLLATPSGREMRPTPQALILSFSASALKAFGIFFICIALAFLMNLFGTSYFGGMVGSLAGIFMSFTNILVFSLFLAFDMCRRYYEVKH